MTKRDFIRKNWLALSLIAIWTVAMLALNAWTYTDSFAEFVK